MPSRLPHALAFALCLLAAVAAWGPVTSGDTFWHLTLGKSTVQAGWFCFAEPVGLSAVPTYCNHYWAWNVPAWLVFEAAGPTGLALLTSLTAGLASLLVVLLARALLPSAPWTALGLAALAVGGMHHRFVARPQAIFLLLVPLLLLLALRWRASERLAWPTAVLGAVLLFWAHAHASVTIAPLLFASLAFGVALRIRSGAERPTLDLEGITRTRLALFAGLALLLLLGPKGIGILGLVAEHADSDIAEHVGEFQRMPFAAWWPPRDSSLAFAEGLLALGFLGALRQRRLELGPFALALLGLAMTANATRFRAVFAVLALPWAALGWQLRSGLQRTGAPEGLERRVLGVLAALAGAALILQDGPRPAGLAPDLFPEGAAQVLDDVGFEGPLFAGHRAGGYLGWRLRGRAKIPLDGRAPLLFNDEEFFATRRAMSEPTPFFALDRRHRFEAAITYKGEATCEGLQSDPRWSPVWVGESFSLFAPPGPLLNQLGPLRSLSPCGGGHLGRCQREPGYGAAARAEAARLLALSPDEQWLGRLQAVLALQCPDGDADEAEQVLGRLSPHPDLPWLRAQLALARGDTEGALASLDPTTRHLDSSLLRLRILRQLDRAADAAPLARTLLAREDDRASLELRELGAWACGATGDHACAARQAIRAALLGSEATRPQLRAMLEDGTMPAPLIPVARGLLQPERPRPESAATPP